MIKALNFEEAFINRNHILSKLVSISITPFLSLLDYKMLIAILKVMFIIIKIQVLMVQCWRSL